MIKMKEISIIIEASTGIGYKLAFCSTEAIHQEFENTGVTVTVLSLVVIN
jgi:short-subunit dehydrogenase